MATDHHGQPDQLGINEARRRERDLSEMLGLAKGMIADGVVNDDEAHYLQQWANAHPDVIDKWPFDIVFRRLKHFFADGRIDEEERAELHELLQGLAGGSIALLTGESTAATSPFDIPPPLICWQGEHFVFTGRFAYGTRTDCQREALLRGAGVDDTVTQLTTFLVVGTFSSRDWVKSTYGRKIEHAARLRAAGMPLRIVGENHWATALWATAAD